MGNKEENLGVIISLLLIALGALVITGFLADQKYPGNGVMVALLSLANTIASGLLGYLTKSALMTKGLGGNG